MRETVSTSTASYPLPAFVYEGVSYDGLYTSSSAAQVAAQAILDAGRDVTYSGNLTHNHGTFISRSPIKRNPLVNGWRQPSVYEYNKLVTGAGTVFRMDVGGGIAKAGQTWVTINNVRKRRYYPLISWDWKPLIGIASPSVSHAPSAISEGVIVNAMARQAKANGLNAALALAESRQTAQLLATYLERIAGVIKVARKRNPKVLFDEYKKIRKSTAPSRKFRDLSPEQRDIQVMRNRKALWNKTRNAADLWLETMYGLRPLIYDVEALLEQLEAGLAQKDQLLVVKSTSKTETSRFEDVSVTGVYSRYGTPTTDRNFTVEAQYLTKEVASGSMWFKVSDPTRVILKSLGFNNIAAVAWDMIPLVSLLTDWVIPIGQYLDTLGYDHGLDFLGGSFTRSQETIVTCTSRNPKVSMISFDVDKRYDMDRKVYTIPPNVAPPTIRNPFRVERAISSVALIRQRIRK